MIIYSLVILSVWMGSLFIPFFFCGFENNESSVQREKTHFLKG